MIDKIEKALTIVVILVGIRFSWHKTNSIILDNKLKKLELRKKSRGK